MPSTRPQAAFEPLAPNLDLKQLVETTPNFNWVVRIDCEMIDHHGLDEFERLILIHVIIGGKPLVIENYDSRLDKWTFAVQWLRDNWGSKVVDARDLTANKNIPLTVQHYLKHMALLTNQWDEKNYKDKDRQRMYLKDIDCPPIWAEKVKDHIPLGIFYMNDGTGDIDGFGAVDEPDTSGPGTRKGRGVAKSGDLMSSLPKEMRAENLMCYIGHEGTYTPAHREMCASLGQNIMVEASTATIEDGKLTKPGTSIWFMTETKERDVVSEYWLSRLGHDIEIEKHFAQVNAWKHAPFKVHVVEQKPGDLILIPPLAPHQVWNCGTRTMKVAWNRTTVETLEMAMDEALPKARMVCRDEQYKNKAIVYYTLQKYYKLLKIADKQKKAGTRRGQSDAKVRQLQKDFKRIQNLFTRIMISESFLLEKPEKNVELVPYDSNITCSYCRCNIFNRFLTCKSCIDQLPNGEEDTYDICMDCYAMGRSCACISKLTWVEQWNWNELLEKHEMFRRQILEIEGKIDEKSPKSLKTELNLLGMRKTLAQICQNELTRRPFHDIKNAAQDPKNDCGIEREEIDEVDVDGSVKKKKKPRRSEKYLREHGRCHVDCYWEPSWKQAHCNHCDKNYCYGNLYRAYDMMPQDIMSDPDWKCPCCRKICGCRHCRHKPGFKQYTPKGTLLGHNTKAVADPRSVESLVDFSFSNIAWIQKAGDDHEEDTRRLRRRLREAELAKATGTQLGEENYVGVEVQPPENLEGRLLQLAEHEGIPIDPALKAMNTLDTPTDSMDVDDEDAVVEHPEGGLQVSDSINDKANELQYSVPDGGIMWNTQHAYDQTDAIIYVYPDIDAPPQLPIPPVEGYTPALVPGYEPALPSESEANIEMIDRKRKRGRLDDGDKPFVYKKAYKGKSKNRKSLVVKLAISKEKLAELERALNLTTQTLSEANAPVISSDLQALNVEHHSTDAHVVTGRARVENIEDPETPEHDDEFTPGRYRERRRLLPDGVTRSAPDSDITRRTTRMQAVTYAEPDEEEFDEVVTKKPAPSKLATMEKAVYDVDTIQSAGEDLGELSQLNISKPPILGNNHAHAHPLGTIQERASADSRQLTASSENTGQRNTRDVQKLKDHVQPNTARISSDASTRPSSSSSSAAALQAPSKEIAQAQANRRAKMAVIEGIGSDTESIDEVWSDAEATPAETPSSKEPSPVPMTTKPIHKAVGGKAPRISLPTTVAARTSFPTSRGPPSSLSAQKVSSADWGDSDSDGDTLPTKKAGQPHPKPGFVAVNANGIGNHVLPPKGATAKRSRGRLLRQR